MSSIKGTVQKYDGKHLVELDVHNLQGNVVKRIKYDKKGNVIKEEWFRSDGTLKQTYNYDKKGEII